MKQLARQVMMIAVIAALVIAALPVGAQDDMQTGKGPQVITGTYETTNPIYPTIGAETHVVLFDLTGQVRRDFDFMTRYETEVLGTLDGDIVSGSYTLSLPAAPDGEAHDFDDDPGTPPAVQVFAPATYIEYLGEDHLNRGEGVLNLAVDIDPMTFEVTGGHVAVWTTHAGELFPAGFGADGLLFTGDDPLLELPAGWSVIALDEEPFAVLREEIVTVPIIESQGELHDYGDLSYADAWDALYTRTRETYPFSNDKNLDWDAIYAEITPLVAQATSDLDFHLIITRFGELVPDTHIGYVSIPVLQNFMLGGVGIAGVKITNAGEIVITHVNPASPADREGIAPGDVLVQIENEDALRYLDGTPLLLTSASTPHGRQFMQAATMLQGPVGSQITLQWHAQESDTRQEQTFTRVMDVSAILTAFGEAVLSEEVVSGRMLDSGLGYIRVTSFAMEVSAANAMFADTLNTLLDAGAQGIIIDMRGNSGGLLGLAMAMAGQFFPDYAPLFDLYYADGSGGFAYRGVIEILPGDVYYDGPVAVLVDEMTGSAGDLFAYAMTRDNRAIIVGHTPTGGFTGEVGDGQYMLPGNLSMQIPTGRPVHPVTGDTLLEGVGVVPDIQVPLTLESVRSSEDEVLQAAEAALRGE